MGEVEEQTLSTSEGRGEAPLGIYRCGELNGEFHGELNGEVW